MILPEQKKRLLKAKIAVAFHDEWGRVPKEEEINQVFLLSRVMYKFESALLGWINENTEDAPPLHDQNMPPAIPLI